MRFIPVFLLLFSFNSVFAQSSFGFIKYKAPEGWQEQTTSDYISYQGIDPTSKLPLEIVIYNSQENAAKPDSAFKTAWRIITPGAADNIPYARKRYNVNGLQTAATVATSSEVADNNKVRYSQLLVFFIKNRMQAVQFITNGPKDFRAIRPFIDEFIDNTESTVPLD